LFGLANWNQAEPVDEAKPFHWQRPNIGSRVTREGHARFWERPEVQFLRATRRLRSFGDLDRAGRLRYRLGLTTARLAPHD
jgi:hypothetical protein